MSSARLMGLGVLVFTLALFACAPAAVPTPSPASPSSLRVIAIETFLADIAQNVGGDRVTIRALMPTGADPHSFEPTPQDSRMIAESDIVIVNGAGFEQFLAKLFQNAGGTHQIIEASKGLTSRTIKADEPRDQDNPGDPHFWFDPTKTIRYVENIRDGLAQADPAGAKVYQNNAAGYITKLEALDAEIQQRVSVIPEANRKLVTDHDTLGYFADRYGFEIVGTIVPSFTTADSSTAQQVARLIDKIRATGAKAILLEASTNPAVAAQIAQDTGARVVTGLYSHSLSEPDGPASTYIEMLQYDTEKIVEALK